MGSFQNRSCWLVLLTVFLFSCCSTCYAQNRPNKKQSSRAILSVQVEEPMLFELPSYVQSDKIIRYSAFTVSYNSSTLNPDWVAYELTKEEADGKVTSRNGRNFVQDPHFKGKQPNYYDYNNTSWDKGHLAPAADMKWSVEAMDECFYYTNCCPQNRDFNGGIWNSLEKNVRSWARKYGQVYVITGPVFSNNQYGTLGTDKVAIPDAFFKACVVPKGDGYSAIGFLMENAFLSGNLNLYACTVDELESIIGLDLFCGLNDQIENEIEAIVKWGDWGFAKPKAITE